jgi:myosin-5
MDDELNDIADLKLRNNDGDDIVENLINLTHLHEPAMLFCLQERYFKSRIYTYTGPILIAVNPFKRVDHLYTQTILEDYYNFGLMRAQGVEVGSPLSPHVYAIADAAYRDMMKVVLHGYGSEKERSRNPGQLTPANQSILISGESGAGKTESTKIVLKYLTTVGKNSNASEDSSVMEKILQSNPILEAFGNARTLRNDNSSRFGKFIELNFSKRGSLIGGSIKTYLLEKVRLPFQQIGERNFHIFYQIFAGASISHKEKWKLSIPEDYNYISRGGIYKLQHVDDAVEYSELRKALDTLNFDPLLQECLFDIVVGILNLGEVRFKSFHDGEGEGSRVDFDDERSSGCIHLSCSLLNIAAEELHSTLCSRTITVSGENYIKKLTAVQASDARDALSKIIYSKLFDWIVKTINMSIRVEQVNVRANIGVLDIFGFESFASNSFEQLCINYTNEALQQQFNQYIFKMEQQEYHREKIEWSFIEFPDNKDCLDLIEHKLNGILAMIDDECRLPKASDEKLAGRMYKAYGSNPRFSATVPQKRDFKFCINHYAGLVEYSTITFVEKNKDELPKEAANVMQSSKNKLLTMIFASDHSMNSRPEKAAVVKGKSSKASPGTAPTSVGFQFKEQLSDLMDSIYATSPHYIRCLKPNDQNEPDNFNRPRITEQLRYGGVLEAVRVARSGFPVRLTHHEFFARYRLVLPAFALKNTPLPFFLKEGDSKLCKETCEHFVVELRNFVNITSKEAQHTKVDVQKYLLFCGVHGLSSESIQVGLTKVFLRKTSYDILESIRFKRCTIATITLQSNFRSYRQKVWYRCILTATALIQRISRGMLARKIALNKRRNKSVIHLQTVFRRFLWEKRYQLFRWVVIKLQSLYRRRVLRKKYLTTQKSRKVILLQSLLRMRKCFRSFKNIRKMIIWAQNRWRMRKAKIVLKKLRMEAKDLGKLKQSNDILKQEIELLKQKAADERERLRKELEQQHQAETVKNKESEILELRAKLEEQLLILESEKRLKETIEHKLNALKESVNVPCLNCEKLKNHIKAQEDVIDRQRNALISTKPVEHESKESQNTKSILEEEVSRLRKLSIEQKVMIDKLQSQLVVEKPAVTKSYVKPISHGSSHHDQLTLTRRRAEKIADVSAIEIPGTSIFDNGKLEEESNGVASNNTVDNSTMVLETVKSFEKNIDAWKNDLRVVRIIINLSREV